MSLEFKLKNVLLASLISVVGCNSGNQNFSNTNFNNDIGKTHWEPI